MKKHLITVAATLLIAAGGLATAGAAQAFFADADGNSDLRLIRVVYDTKTGIEVGADLTAPPSTPANITNGLSSATTGISSTANIDLAALVGGKTSSGFFFDGSDSPGAGLNLSMVNSSAGNFRFTIASLPTPDATTSPAPLPPAIFLMGSGLAGIFGIRKKIRP